MSLLTNSVSYMAQVFRQGVEESETFHKFFECWLAEQSQHLEALVSASKEHDQQDGRITEFDESVLRPLLHRVVQHYENYYKEKTRSAKHNVLAMFKPSWTSTLEDAFLWIGGWRPSMAFHLLYSKSGQQFEAKLSELIRGLSTGDLGDLSPFQLSQVDEMQRRTIREEKEITERQAKHQETIADSSMVELSNAVSELKRREAGLEGGERGGEVDERQVEETLKPKEEGLVEILQRADELRVKTIKEIVNILTPVQGVHFLIAAAELHLRVHEWGKRMETRHHQAGRDEHQQ